MIPPNQSPVANMLRARRDTPGTGGAGAEALINQMGQRPNRALPSSTPESRPVEMPSNTGQVVTGKDGQEYHIVIDPKVGLQTFIPVKGQRNRTVMPQQRVAGVNPPGLPGRLGRVAAMGGDAAQGNQTMNKLRGMISGLG